MKANKIIVIGLLAAAAVVPATSQKKNNTSDMQQSFEEFRRGLFQEYEEFRKSIFDEYAEFLNKEWGEFDVMSTGERLVAPKPEYTPVIADDTFSDNEVQIKVVSTASDSDASAADDETVVSSDDMTTNAFFKLPRYKRQQSVKKSKSKTAPKQPERKPVASGSSAPKKKTVTPSSSKKDSKKQGKNDKGGKPTATSQTAQAKQPAAQTPAQPAPKAVTPAVPSGKQITFDFYGMDVTIPDFDYSIMATLDPERESGAQMKQLGEAGVDRTVLPALQKIADQWGLNDYLTSQLYKYYVNARFPEADDFSRMSLLHFLLVSDGYDARYAYVVEGKFPILLFPTVQERLFSRGIWRDRELGNKYYAFQFIDNDRLPGTYHIRTCPLPSDRDLGRKFDMRIGNLNLPYKAHPFNLVVDNVNIQGEVNENIFAMLWRYPQMEIGQYAQSCLDENLRKQIVDQVRASLDGMTPYEAVNTLMHFMHYAFKYETDQRLHGFEKPYFFEETLFYDKCDCEDRAIFFSYLLWNALGVDCHIIQYPGHEAVALSMPNEKLRGTSYRWNEQSYFISDPTYTNSRVGQCPPDYASAPPEIDYEYKN